MPGSHGRPDATGNARPSAQGTSARPGTPGRSGGPRRDEPDTPRASGRAESSRQDGRSGRPGEHGGESPPAAPHPSDRPQGPRQAGRGEAGRGAERRQGAPSGVPRKGRPSGGARRSGSATRRDDGNAPGRDGGRNATRRDERRGQRRAGDDPRGVAYDVLRAVEERDAYANLVLPQSLRERRLSGRDAALATELTYGTLRGRGTYDAILALCSDRPLERIDPALLDALRLGAHQLLRTRVPAHAAVATTVNLVRAHVGEGPARFANAILRKITTRDADAWLEIAAPSADTDPVGHLAVVHSHPRWVVSALRDAVGGGTDETAALLAADNAAPGVTLLAKPGQSTPAELIEAGATPATWSPYAAHLPSGDPSRIPAIAEGRAAVQDEASQLVALTLATAPLTGAQSTPRPSAGHAAAQATDEAAAAAGQAAPGHATGQAFGQATGRAAAQAAGQAAWQTTGQAADEADEAAVGHAAVGRAAAGEDRAGQPSGAATPQPLAERDAAAPPSTGLWLDMCAGPGGKAAVLAGLAAREGARLLAADVGVNRAKLARRALAGEIRAGNARVVVADGTQEAWKDGRFDRVLVDAPCTGLGALRRRPEARWRRGPEAVAELGQIQRRLLASALDAVRPGGVVAYVTCSPHLGETRVVVEDILRTRPDVESLDAPTVLTGALDDPPDLDPGPYLWFWPHCHGTDAMFCALLRRVPGA